jgi:anti-sigma factor RsiW
MMNDEMLDVLYRSLDGVLEPEDERRLEDALASSESLREEKARILAIRETLATSAAKSFRPFFAEHVTNVLSKEAQPETFLESLSYVFRRVALAGAAAVVALAIFNIANSDKVSATAALGVPEITIDDVMETPFESVMEAFS